MKSFCGELPISSDTCAASVVLAKARNWEAKGGRLIVREGPADVALEKLFRETGAAAIYFARDPDPNGRAMEVRVATMARRLGVTVRSHQDHALHERDEVLTGSGTPFRVFTLYARAWLKLDKPAPGRTPARLSTPPEIASLLLPTLATWGLTSEAQMNEPGEAAARKRLARFLDGPVFDYGTLRDIPVAESTSPLSQDLRSGLLSIREIHARCAELAARAVVRNARALASGLMNSSGVSSTFTSSGTLPRCSITNSNPRLAH